MISNTLRAASAGSDFVVLTAETELADAQRILEAAQELLEQGVSLLDGLQPEQYSSPVPAVFNGSIGAHYRHCLDHFLCLLDPAAGHSVNYDQRARDPRIERDPNFARESTRQLCRRLGQLDPSALGARVATRCQVSYAPGDSPASDSTLGREIMYAIAHGIHHYALISVMSRLMNYPLPPNFGVAPSTVAFQRNSVWR